MSNDAEQGLGSLNGDISHLDAIAQIEMHKTNADLASNSVHPGETQEKLDDRPEFVIRFMERLDNFLDRYNLRPIKNEGEVKQIEELTPMEMEEFQVKLTFQSNLFFFLTEVLVIPRFILLPVLLLSMLGGPVYLIVPWSLWALFFYLFQAAIYFYPQHTPNVSPSTWEVLKTIFDEVAFRCFNGRNDLSANESYQRISQEEYTVGIPTKTFVFQLVVSIFDMILSAATFLIVGFLLIYIFESPDAYNEPGWASEFALGIAVMVNSLMSFMFKIILSVFSSFFHCKKTPRRKYYREYRIEAIYFLVYTSFAIIALAFCSFTLNWQLNAVYYNDQHTASYSHCDNMVSKVCSLPFPSYTWLTADATTETGMLCIVQIILFYSNGIDSSGFRVSIEESTLPYTKRGIHIKGKYINDYDGFSVAGPLLWHLPGMREEDFVSFQEIDRSMYANSTTLLIDLTDSERKRY